MTIKSCPTIEVRIYIAGPIDIAKQTIRKYCMEKGFCVTIDSTLFIYTGGEEYGYVIGIRNYPRFPSDIEKLLQHGDALAKLLLEDTYQKSVLVVAPRTTHWFSKREAIEVRKRLI